MPDGSLQWVYYAGTGTGATNLGQDTVRLGQGMAAGMESSAETGETASSSIEVDDPNATWNFVGLHSFYGVENAAPLGNHRLWTGILGERIVRRGQNDSLRTGAARRWDITLIDHNEILGRRVINDTVEVGGDRPAETIAARLTWLLGSAFLTLVTDQGLVQYPTDALDANDYRGQTPAQVISDMAAVVGYLWFAKHNETSGTPELAFFDPNNLTIYTSAAAFSNVLSDVMAGSLMVEPDAEVRFDPQGVYAGCYATGSGVSTYRTRPATAAAFGGWRDTTATFPFVKTLAKLEAITDRHLVELSTEAERVIWNSWVPAAHVNDVHEGELTMITLSHVPGYAGGRTVRVLRRNVMASQPTDEFYMVHYEAIPICSPAQTSSTDDILLGKSITAFGGPAGDRWNTLPDNPGNINDGDLTTLTNINNGIIHAVPSPTWFYGGWDVDMVTPTTMWESWILVDTGGDTNPNDGSQPAEGTGVPIMSTWSSDDGLTWTFQGNSWASGSRPPQFPGPPVGASTWWVVPVGDQTTPHRYWRLQYSFYASIGFSFVEGISIREWVLTQSVCA